MPVKPKRRKIAKKRDIVSVSMSLPDDVYIELKHAAKANIRSIGQQARYFMEIGMELIAQQMEMEDAPPEEEEEATPAIGFVVEKEDDEDMD